MHGAEAESGGRFASEIRLARKRLKELLDA
jgi:hypothetical protein